MSETTTIGDRRAVERGIPDRRRYQREPFVEFQDLHKSYGVKQVLRGASLKVYRGEVLVILGGSGTGKSVTLRHMLGLEVPDSGRVIVEQEDVTDLPEEELYRVRKKFGMLFQSAALFDSMTVFENIAFPLREHTEMSEEEIARAVREKLELVNLPNTEHLMPVDLSGGMRKRVGLARSIVLDPKVILYDEPTTGLDPITAQTINELIVDLPNVQDKYPAELSGGMRKRVGLARAIALRPKYILYDEPTTGLDPVTSAVIDELMIRMRDRLGVTSIVITHDMRSAYRVGTRIAMLYDGQVRTVATVDEIQQTTDPVVRQFIEGRAELDIDDPQAA